MDTKKRTLKERLQIVLKYIYVVMLFVILGGGLSIYYIAKTPVAYESKGLIYISSNNYEMESNVNIKTLVIHFGTKDLLQPVISNLNLPYHYQELSKMVSLKQLKETELLEVRVRSLNSAEPQTIITEMIRTFEEKKEEFYPNLSIKIVETATISDAILIDQNVAMTIGMLIGAIVGIILVLLFGTIDIYIKNHEDMKKYLGLRSLGIIPDYTVEEENPKNKNKKNKEKEKIGLLPIVSDPASMMSESYRMVRTNLDFLDLKVINFTSTTASEGKSESISNVALAFSMIGKKVLVIDCDLRKPMIHKKFTLNRGQGLTDIVIYNRLEEYQNYIQEYTIPHSEQKIHILSSGSKISNPSELLNSPRFVAFIEKLKQEYDLILLDCPPVSLMTDATVVSKVADGTVYIIEYNRNNYDMIKVALDSLKDVESFVVGGILTKVNIRKQKRLYGNKYDYYSNYV